MPSPENLSAYWIRWRSKKDLEAREHILNSYVPLVKRLFSRLRVGLPQSTGTQLEQDLIQSGVIGLIQAFETFKDGTGTPFGAFASFRIRGAMLDELRKQDWLSKNCRRRLKEIQRAYAELDLQLGRHATDEEVAKSLSISEGQLRQELLEIGPATLGFLDGLGGEDGQGSWQDFIKDPSAASPDEELQRKELSGVLAQAIDQLPKQEKTVLTLLVYDELGQKEISQVLGVSPSRVSQIYAKAIIRLRTAIAAAVSKTAQT